MNFASPYLDPQLDAPQPVTRTHPLAGAVVTERGGNTLNSNFNTQQQPFVRPRAEVGSQKDSLRPAAETSCDAFKAATPHTHSNRALLEGFASLIRLQADRLQQSVIFALICMLVPTVIAVTVIGYAVLKPIY